ncbi:MAG: hypothetical protein ACLP8S_24910 [Solirubrobacteraceae bacterium]
MSAPESPHRTVTDTVARFLHARSDHARSLQGLLRALAVLAASCGLLAVSATAATAATAARWKWSRVYALPGAPTGIGGISCPSTSLCVAIGHSGNLNTGHATDNVYWTTNPTRGMRAWHVQALEPEIQPAIAPKQAELLSAVSCVKVGKSIGCAISDGFANLWRTSDPARGAKAWRKSIPNDTGLVALSCWSAWCGEIDAYGDGVITIGARLHSSSDAFRIPKGTDAAGIGCNAASFCAAVDLTHTVAWTDDAARGPAVWHSATLNGGTDLDTIACPTIELCVATEGEVSSTAWIGVSHNPGAGAGTWRSVELPRIDPSVYTVACPSASLCAVGGTNFILTSTKPAAKLSAWQRSSVPFAVENLSCPTTTECIATEGSGDEVIVGQLVRSHRR